MCANVHRCPAYLLNPGIIFVLLIPQQQWRLFQLKKCAQQFVRMDDLGFAVTMRANQSTAGRAVCAAIAPRPACSRTFSLLARFQTVERWTANFGFLRSHLAAHRRFAARTLSLFFIFQRRLTCRRVSLLRSDVASAVTMRIDDPPPTVVCHRAAIAP